MMPTEEETDCGSQELQDGKGMYSACSAWILLLIKVGLSPFN